MTWHLTRTAIGCYWLSSRRCTALPGRRIYMILIVRSLQRNLRTCQTHEFLFPLSLLVLLLGSCYAPPGAIHAAAAGNLMVLAKENLVTGTRRLISY